MKDEGKKIITKEEKRIEDIKSEYLFEQIKEEYKYSVEDIQKLLDEFIKEFESTQFTKLSEYDNLYHYKDKNFSIVGTLDFFERLDKEVRENIKKYGRL